MRKKKILRPNCNKHADKCLADNEEEYNSMCLFQNCYQRNYSEAIKKEKEIFKDSLISGLAKLRAIHHMETMNFDYLIRYIANF